MRVVVSGARQASKLTVLTIFGVVSAIFPLMTAAQDEDVGRPAWMLYLATDSDFDGVPNRADAFPGDRNESVDTDGDGIGNNADLDDDGDGVDDAIDWLPLDATEFADTDGDGVGDNRDPDDDNDGIPDLADDEPLISSLDSDGDGIPDRLDEYPDNPANATDSDGDGVFDLFDTLPDRGEVNKALSFSLADVNSAGVSESLKINDGVANESAVKPGRNNLVPQASVDGSVALSNQTNVVSWDSEGSVLADVILSSETTFVAESVLTPDGSALYILTAPEIQRAIAGQGVQEIDIDACQLYRVDTSDNSFDCVLDSNDPEIRSVLTNLFWRDDYLRSALSFRADGVAVAETSQGPIVIQRDGSWQLYDSTSRIAPEGFVKLIENIVWLDDEHIAVASNVFPEEGGATTSYWTAFNVETGEEVAEVEAETFRAVKHRSTLYTSGTKIDWTGSEFIVTSSGAPVQDTQGNLWFKDNVYGLELTNVAGDLQVSLGEEDTSGPNIYLESGTGSRIVYQDLAFEGDWILAKYSRKAKNPVLTLEGLTYGDREPLFVDLPGDAGSLAKLTDPDLWYYIRSGNEQSDISIEYTVSTDGGSEVRQLLIPLEAINSFASFDGTIYDPSGYDEGYELLQQNGEGVALELPNPESERSTFCLYQISSKIQRCAELDEYEVKRTDIENLRNNIEPHFPPSYYAYDDLSQRAYPGVQNVVFGGGQLIAYFKDSRDNQYYRASADLEGFMLDGDAALTITPVNNGGGESEIIAKTAKVTPGVQQILDAVSVEYLKGEVSVTLSETLSAVAPPPKLALKETASETEISLVDTRLSADRQTVSANVVDKSELSVTAYEVLFDGYFFVDGSSLRYGLSETPSFNLTQALLTEDIDTDADGIGNAVDEDDDGDGVLDADDLFPLDATESSDSDADGIGNNADTDDDNDGVADDFDTFPLDAGEAFDADSDGIGDNADTDDDNDSVADTDDAFPLDAAASIDTDGDGSPDDWNPDATDSQIADSDLLVDEDDDDDGVADNQDEFPTDASEAADTDGDGIGNNADPDDDGDGVVDEEDDFPVDASETVDSDSDGVGDNADAFPNDASETSDSDSDGVGDNADAFPNDPLETADTDNDGVGDNADAFPTDASETTDSDGDGVGDNADAFPNDPTRSEPEGSDGWSIYGIWKLSSEAGSYGVGPGEFDTQWWNDTVEDARTVRDCFFDDEVIFDVDGSFTNILGDETWIEEWQGADSNQCGTPIAPHDGTVNATYDFDEPANSLTITGVGAYLVNPAAFNGGELADSSSAPESITYNVYPQADGSMDVTIETDAGAWWNATYVKVGEIDPPSETEADFSLGFGGANFGEGGTYTVPSSAESWAGYANANFALYPLTFEDGGRISFMASVPDGGTADVRFRLERLPFDENDPSATEPSIDTVAVTLTGTEPALYEILIDPQGENTYSSFIMYIDTRDVTVTITDVMVDYGPAPEFADFTGGAFDGTTVDEGDIYTFPSGEGVQDWAGFANTNEALYPLNFPEGGEVRFRAMIPEGGAATTIFFKFENAPWPDVNPSFETEQVIISGGLADYGVQIPPQDPNQDYRSFLLYLVERDQPVMIRDVEVVVNGDQPGTLVDSDNDGVVDAEDAFPNDPLETADSDNDGVGDNADAFPNDASETTDSDGDGVGDNADAYPNDPSLTEGPGPSGDGSLDFSAGAFGGAQVGYDEVQDLTSYWFPTGAETFAGFANTNEALYPLSFEAGGQVVLDAMIPSGGSASIYVRFEKNPFPDVDPAYDTESIVISGADLSRYTIDIPSLEDTTYSSVVLYVVEQDIEVGIVSICVNSDTTSCDSNGPGQGTGSENGSLDFFSGAFGGAQTGYDDTQGTTWYWFPTGAETFAGFANTNAAMYPLSFEAGGQVVLEASIPSSGSASIYVRFEKNPFPDVDPAYDTESVVISGGQLSSYTIDIPSLEDTTYSSVILYVVEQDIEVAIASICVDSDTTDCETQGGGLDTDGDGVVDAEDAFPNDPSETGDFDGDGVGDNADAFPTDPTRSEPDGADSWTGIQGYWRLSTERGSYGVGPGEFDTQWWNDTVGDARIARDCFFDDEVIFDVDGSFTNILGDETWIEEWQGADSNQCGTPIAPHDGTVNATYDFDEPANSLTITGVGAYLVNPAAFNGGELADPSSAPESITYNVYPQADGSMDVTIETDAGAWWNATYVKVGEIDPPSETEADFSLGFGGANFGEGGTYTVPSSAESWAGYANANTALYPLTFEDGGRISFMASAPEGVSVDVRFRLERLPYDENDPSATEPSIDTVAVTVTGAEPALYEILIDPQGDNTYSSFIMYIDTRDVTVTITDVMVDSGAGS